MITVVANLDAFGLLWAFVISRVAVFCRFFELCFVILGCNHCWMALVCSGTLGELLQFVFLIETWETSYKKKREQLIDMCRCFSSPLNSSRKGFFEFATVRICIWWFITSCLADIFRWYLLMWQILGNSFFLRCRADVVVVWIPSVDLLGTRAPK